MAKLKLLGAVALKSRFVIVGAAGVYALLGWAFGDLDPAAAFAKFVAIAGLAG